MEPPTGVWCKITSVVTNKVTNVSQLKEWNVPVVESIPNSKKKTPPRLKVKTFGFEHNLCQNVAEVQRKSSLDGILMDLAHDDWSLCRVGFGCSEDVPSIKKGQFCSNDFIMNETYDEVSFSCLKLCPSVTFSKR